VSGFNSQCRTFISVSNQPPRSSQPTIWIFVGRCSEYQPKGGDALQLGSKASMVRVWAAGETVWPHCYTWVISEHFRDKRYKALYKFILFTLNL